METAQRQGRRMTMVCCLILGGLLWPWHTSAQPAIEAWETSNGARVLFARTPELPIMDVRIVFAAGSARDAGAAGLARLTNSLLDDGAGGLDANAMAERLDGVGARFETFTGQDMAGGELRTLTDSTLARPALETFALMLGSPTFPPEAFERERARLQVSARLRHQAVGEVAEETFWQAVYDDHPYAQPPGGTEASLAALTREQVVGFYQRYYVGRNAVIAIVGDLNRAQAESVAERLVRELPAGQAAPDLPPVPPVKEARTVRLPFPSSQTHLLVGQPGMARNDPLFFPLHVGNHVLGGSGLVSQLFEEIRARRGLAYSVYSSFLPLARPGPFIAGLQTRNEQAEPALLVLHDTLRHFVEQGPSAAELSLAKKQLIGSFPLQLDSNQKIVAALAIMGFYALPLDYLARFPAHVEAVEVADVHAALQARIHPQRLVTVMAGGAVKTPE